MLIIFFSFVNYYFVIRLLNEKLVLLINIFSSQKYFEKK
jgi:hypothetical protein